MAQTSGIFTDEETTDVFRGHDTNNSSTIDSITTELNQITFLNSTIPDTDTTP